MVPLITMVTVTPGPLKGVQLKNTERGPFRSPLAALAPLYTIIPGIPQQWLALHLYICYTFCRIIVKRPVLITALRWRVNTALPWPKRGATQQLSPVTVVVVPVNRTGAIRILFRLTVPEWTASVCYFPLLHYPPQAPLAKTLLLSTLVTLSLANPGFNLKSTVVLCYKAQPCPKALPPLLQLLCLRAPPQVN